MKCGFYELDITPPLGSIIPGAFAARYADEVLDNLFVRAFVAKNGTKTLAVAIIDACGITLDVTEAVRKRVASASDILPEDVMVMATHTHGGGPTLNWGEQVVRNPEYIKFISEKAADAIVLANKKAAESELYFGREELTDVSFIRVYELKGGRLKTNPNGEEINEIVKPTSTIDPEVYVLAVKQNDSFVGAIVNFANHPATVATNQITGDYISTLSYEMKKIYGEDFITLFINGACGNINHINPFDTETRVKGRYWTVGAKVAEKAVSAISNASPMTDETLKSNIETISVRFRKPDKAQLLAAKDWFDSLGDELIDSEPGKTDGLKYMETFFALQTFWSMADKRTQRDVQLQLFKIGECYIFGAPAQLFVEYGKKIKQACTGNCFVSAFATDYCGYVPTPECMKEGVYEARLATSSCLEPAAGDKIADALIDMHHKMN